MFPLTVAFNPLQSNQNENEEKWVATIMYILRQILSNKIEENMSSNTVYPPNSLYRYELNIFLQL